MKEYNGLCLFRIENEQLTFRRFLVMSEVPELYRKLREARRKHVPQVSSKSAQVTPSGLQTCVFHPLERHGYSKNNVKNMKNKKTNEKQCLNMV